MTPGGTDNLKRNLLFNTAGNVIYFVCQWVITGFLVKRLAPGDAGLINAGLLATAQSVTNVFLTLASFGMRTFQVSDISGKYTDGEYISSRAVTVGAAVVLCIGYTFLLGYGALQSACIAIFLVYKLIEAVSDVFHGCCQKKDRMEVIGISYGVRGILAVVVFSSVYVVSKDLVWALAAMTVCCLVFSIFYDIVRNKPFYSPSGGVSTANVWALLLQCMPLAAYAFLNTGAASIPKIVLGRVWGEELMGVYGLANAPVLILQVGAVFLFTPFLIVFTKLYEQGDRKGFAKLALKVSGFVAALTAMAFVAVQFIGSFGLKLLYGEVVAAYDYLLPLMTLCAGLTSLVIFVCMLLTVTRCIHGLIISTAVGAAVSAAASFLLIKPYILNGTNYASAAALTVELVCLALFLWRSLNVKK